MVTFAHADARHDSYRHGHGKTLPMHEIFSECPHIPGGTRVHRL